MPPAATSRGLIAGTLIGLETMSKRPRKGLFANVPDMDEIVDDTNEELRRRLLVREDIASRHIAIGEIPGRAPTPGSTTAYPYDEWAKIPPGKAVEITLLLRNRHPQGVGRTLTRYFEGHNMGLHVVLRQKGGRWRMWVIRPHKKEEQQ